MATALVTSGIAGYDSSNYPNIDLSFTTVFFGSEVPGGEDTESVTVTVSMTNALQEINTALAAAISAKAVALGYNAPGVGETVFASFIRV